MEFKYCVIGDMCYQFMRGNREEESEKEINFRNEENITPFTKYQMYRSVFDNPESNGNRNFKKSNINKKKIEKKKL